MCPIRSRHVLTVTCVPVVIVQESKGAEIKDWVQQGSFVLLSGMLSIRQTRPTLLFRKEATDFCGTSPAPVCLPVFQQGSVWVVGGRMVILSPQMDRKNPGGIWGAMGDVVFTVCACACVFEILAWSILVLWWGCLRPNPLLMQQMSSLSVWVALQIIRSVRCEAITHVRACKQYWLWVQRASLASPSFFNFSATILFKCSITCYFCVNCLFINAFHENDMFLYSEFMTDDKCNRTFLCA